MSVRAEPRLYRIADAAEALGVSRSTLYELIAAGELPAVRVGRSLRVAAADLDDYVEKLRTEAAAR